MYLRRVDGFCCFPLRHVSGFRLDLAGCVLSIAFMPGHVWLHDPATHATKRFYRD